MKGAVGPRTGHSLAQRFQILVRLGVRFLAEQINIANIALKFRPRYFHHHDFPLQLDSPLLVQRMLNLFLLVSELLVHDVFNQGLDDAEDLVLG